jgi:HSP20 family protein
MNEKNHPTNESTPETREPERMRPGAVLTPRADIFETKDAVHLIADMPGVDETSVDITLEKNVLTISGRPTLQEVEGCRRVYSEFRAGEYVRSFQLSNEVDASNIQATVKNGVLKLSVPKRKPSTRKITISAPSQATR